VNHIVNCPTRRMKSISGISVMVLALFFSAALASSGHAEVLTLAEGLKLVTENSRLVKIVDHEERMSEADTLIARSRLLPEINASGGYTSLAYEPQAIFGPQVVPISEKNFLAYSLSVQQTLFDFQKNASRYQESKKMLNAKKLDVARIRNLVAIDFVLAYLDILESDNRVKVSEKEVDRLGSHLRDAKNLYEEGVITKNDLLQAEVRISDARQRLLTARNDRRVAAARLNSILVRPLTAEVQVQEIGDTAPQRIDMEMERAWETAEKQRPEVRIATETLEALDLERRAIKAEYYPRFFVTGGYDYTENRYQFHEGNWSVTLGMGINLFQGGLTRAELLKVDSRRMKLIEEKNKLVDDIRLEVERYMLEAKTARDRVSVTQDAVQQAEENLRINRVRYEEGVGTATDVLDAVTLLTIAETNNYRSVYDLQKAQAAVFYAIGTELSEVYK
jgi:outer membrane protein